MYNYVPEYQSRVSQWHQNKVRSFCLVSQPLPDPERVWAKAGPDPLQNQKTQRPCGRGLYLLHTLKTTETWDNVEDLGSWSLWIMKCLIVFSFPGEPRINAQPFLVFPQEVYGEKKGDHRIPYSLWWMKGCRILWNGHSSSNNLLFHINSC